MKRQKNNLILSEFSIFEENVDHIEYKLDDGKFSDFNLLIGDNAQGKTRLINIFKFIKEIFTGNPRGIATKFHGKFKFEERNKKKNIIVYEIFISPSDKGNIYDELVKNNDKIVFSSKEKILINEKQNKKIDNFYVSKSIPSALSIDENDFYSMNLIRDFFQRILILNSNKNKDVKIEEGAKIPNYDGTNLSSVLSTWESNYPEIFNETILDFRRCFEFVEKVELIDAPMFQRRSGKFLSLKEKEGSNNIIQVNWSDGMYRAILLISLPKTVINANKKEYPPSMIFIDEIENGLDYKTLKFMINYLKDYSDEFQIIMSTHSPLLIDFIHPSNWKIISRKGSVIQMKIFREDDQILESQLEIFKYKHYEFYTEHVSDDPFVIN